MRLRSYFFLISLLCASRAFAQQDTLRQLEQVVVTASRTERPADMLAVPTLVIDQRQMQRMGGLRLGQVLEEQTGLSLVHDHGVGLQLQGMDPQYTAILVDGEPLIGRTAGTLDLNRIAVGGIDRIEVVKGPSSSLYGSDALAGVVNLITRKPMGCGFWTSARYGANRTSDLAMQGQYTRERWSARLFANRYATAGYTLGDAPLQSPTVAPSTSYTFAPRLQVSLSDRMRLSASARWMRETQDSYFFVQEKGEDRQVDTRGKVDDRNMQLQWEYRPLPALSLQAKYYGATYMATSSDRYAQDGSMYAEEFFDQYLGRWEGMATYTPSERHQLIGGAGATLETLEATRYEREHRQQGRYAFLQHEWTPSERMTLSTGGRYDHNSAYGGRFSPKLSARYRLLPSLTLRASAGSGFRAPDFRQLYLNFSNLSVGYMVFGSKEVAHKLQELQQAGQLTQVFLSGTQEELRPETSWSYNLGLNWKPLSNVSVELNAFHNRVSNLIDTRPFAQQQNGQFVYSYLNVEQVRTQGAEVQLRWQPLPRWTLSGGYQYLQADDLQALEQVKRGEVYARDPWTQQTTRVTRKQYGGLMNRSRHSANLRLNYDHASWHGALRLVYRGRFGLQDLNGSGLLDADYEYADGYLLCNLSASRDLGKHWTAQTGVDNLLDYTSANLPGLPGRLWYASIRFEFFSRQ